MSWPWKVLSGFSTGSWLNQSYILKRLSWHQLRGFHKGKWFQEEETHWKAIIVGNYLAQGNKGLKGGSTDGRMQVQKRGGRYRNTAGVGLRELMSNWISVGCGGGGKGNEKKDHWWQQQWRLLSVSSYPGSLGLTETLERRAPTSTNDRKLVLPVSHWGRGKFASFFSFTAEHS